MIEILLMREVRVKPNNKLVGGETKNSDLKDAETLHRAEGNYSRVWTFHIFAQLLLSFDNMSYGVRWHQLHRVYLLYLFTQKQVLFLKKEDSKVDGG